MEGKIQRTLTTLFKMFKEEIGLLDLHTALLFVKQKWASKLCDSVKQKYHHRLFDDFWKIKSWNSIKIYVCLTVEIRVL